MKNNPAHRAYIITGPTSGIGRATAFELAKHGTIVLVGRNRTKLKQVQKVIEKHSCRILPMVRTSFSLLPR